MNEKYLAGFIDADGHISIRARVGARPDLCVVISQRVMYTDPLEYARDQFGGKIYIKTVGDAQYGILDMRCGPARKCLERLSKYMVLKKHHALQMMKLVDESPVLHSKEDVLSIRAKVSAIRAQGTGTIPNYPSRKWVAGYFDGDGNFSVKVDKSNSFGYPHAAIIAAKNYTAGIVLLNRAFGGNMCSVGQNTLWTLMLQPSKAIEFLSYFAKHLVIKKPQAYFLLGCAEHNFRDGITVRDTIKALNSQQHRLSDPEGEASRLVSTVDFTIEKIKSGRPSKR